MKTYLSADEYLRDIWRLAASVRASEWRPDLILALWRGGAPVGVAVHEFLRESGWTVDHLPLKCASYSGIGKNEGDVVFSLGEAVFAAIGKGLKVLVADDVFDTGKTAAAVMKRLADAGAEARFAAVYWKPEKNQTNLKPDYFVKNTDNSWIVFPHEINGLTAREIEEKDPFLAAQLQNFNSMRA